MGDDLLAVVESPIHMCDPLHHNMYDYMLKQKKICIYITWIFIIFVFEVVNKYYVL